MPSRKDAKGEVILLVGGVNCRNRGGTEDTEGRRAGAELSPSRKDCEGEVILPVGWVNGRNHGAAEPQRTENLEGLGRRSRKAEDANGR